MMQSNVAPTIKANDGSGMIHLPECESDVAVRDGGPRIGRISTGFRPPQAVDEKFGCLFQVQNGKAEVVDSLGYRHTVQRRLTPQFSGRALPSEERRVCIMK
jgi:hypothetical protein